MFTWGASDTGKVTQVVQMAGQEEVGENGGGGEVVWGTLGPVSHPPIHLPSNRPSLSPTPPHTWLPPHHSRLPLKPSHHTLSLTTTSTRHLASPPWSL